jgi:hypothetical protein
MCVHRFDLIGGKDLVVGMPGYNIELFAIFKRMLVSGIS